jgi:hypothetical protein
MQASTNGYPPWMFRAGKVWRHYVGLDLGQVKDYSALAILKEFRGTIEAPLPLDQEGREFEVIHLHRFKLGTAYPAIVEAVARVVQRLGDKNNVDLIVDATGVGLPVVDLFRNQLGDYSSRLRPVMITGGNAASRDGSLWRVPKRDLVSAVQVMLQNERLKIAEDQPFVETLTKEMMTFKVKVTTSANDTYGAWREGEHDDLVLAVALAAWYARTEGKYGPATVRRYA